MTAVPVPTSAADWKRRVRRRAFTLIEVLIALAIFLMAMAVFGSMIVPGQPAGQIVGGIKVGQGGLLIPPPLIEIQIRGLLLDKGPIYSRVPIILSYRREGEVILAATLFLRREYFAEVGGMELRDPLQEQP